MPFPPRSSSRRLQKNVRTKGNQEQEIKEKEPATIDAHEVFDSIDEAVNEHRRSMAGRPQSAGVDKRRPKRPLSTRRPTPPAAKEAAELLRAQPTCGKDLERNGQVIEYSSGLDKFNFPTPSPRMPPRSATFDPCGLSPSPGMFARSKTYCNSPLLQPCDNSPRIGMAIGSPSQGLPTWGRSRTAGVLRTRRTAGLPPTSSAPAVQNEEQADIPSKEPQAKKKSNWKAFSNLFRSKTATEPFYKVKPEATTVAATVPYDALSSKGKVVQVDQSERPPTPLSCLLAPSPNMQKLTNSPEPLPGRGTRQDQHIDKGLRTSIMPKGLGLRMRGTPTPPPVTKSPGFWRRSEDAFGQRQARYDSPLSADDEKAWTTQRTPQLALDLPTLDFPRYSIMFEKQLSNGTKPSLLERRQSRFQRSQSQGADDDHLRVNTSNAGVRRSKTSPSFRRKLSIRTKEEEEPTEERPTTSIRRPGPMPRSKTEPATADFMRPTRKDTQQSSSSPESRASAFYSENSLPPNPSTSTDNDSVLETAQPPVPPPTLRSKSYSFPTNAATSPSPPDLEILHTPLLPLVKASGHDIIQFSVARQVSVSRARTRVMRAMEGTAKPAVVPLKPRLVEYSAQDRKSAAASLVLGDADIVDMEEMPRDAVAHSRAASLAFAAEVENRKSGKVEA